MTRLGEEILGFLQKHPEVTMAHDYSSRDTGDGIRCCFGGANWFIAIEKGCPLFPVDDPREMKEDNDNGSKDE